LKPQEDKNSKRGILFLPATAINSDIARAYAVVSQRDLRSNHLTQEYYDISFSFSYFWAGAACLERRITRHPGMPPLLNGMVIVGFGTPVLFTSPCDSTICNGANPHFSRGYVVDTENRSKGPGK